MIALPESFNYIGIFLTYRCPYRCSYCINTFHSARAQRDMKRTECNADQWVTFFRQLDTHGVPITLQGGEPGVHPEFTDIVERTLAFHQVDILTNLAFDLDAFIARIDPEKMNREAPYAPIRVSYHPEQFSLETIVARVKKMQSAGFRVGLYGVMHPAQEQLVLDAQKQCLDEGIDFRVKPFLGMYQGKLYGEYAFPDGCSGVQKTCECAPTELLVGPDGLIYRCHYFCYTKAENRGHISDQDLTLSDAYRFCDQFGHCNPCDLKIKNNRFQQFGHIAAHIRNIRDIN